MSAPTVTDTGYEIEEHTRADAIHIRAVDTRPGKWRAGIVGALLRTDRGDDEEWHLLVYGGVDSDLLPLSLIPNGTVQTRSKETAIEWIRCIAALYAKAVAA